MHYMVLFVLDELEKSADVLQAWEDAGCSGITIMETTGLGRLRRLQGGARDDFPLLPSLRSLLRSREEQHRTFFSVVDSEAMVDTLVARTQEIVGDLAAAHRGVIFVLPVVRAIGLATAKTDDNE